MGLLKPGYLTSMMITGYDKTVEQVGKVTF